MRLIKMLLFIVSFIILIGCTNSETEVKHKVYQKFFSEIVRAGITKILPLTESTVIIPEDEVKVFKEEMKDISDIKEYTSYAAYSTNFKDDFRLLLLHTRQTIKDDKFMGCLYSTKQSRMIVRKYDLFPDFREEPPKLTVYEFKIPTKVVKLLKKYESQLPKDGFFYNSWPPIHYK